MRRPRTRSYSDQAAASASKALLDELDRIVGLAVAMALLPLRQLHFVARRLLVRNLLEQVGDDVQAPAPLVVGPRHVPRRELRVRRREHLVAGPRVVVPATVGLQIHRRELPDLPPVVDT